MRPAIEEIAEQFNMRTGRRLRLVYGATGTLVHQIEHGAQFELFLAADETSVARLVAARRTLGKVATLVRGHLAIAVPKSSPLGTKLAQLSLENVLTHQTVKRIAIANPRLAPYGVAARQALLSTRIWERVSDKIVYADNVAQAALYVASGAVDAGLIARSDALALGGNHQVVAAPVAESTYPAINQGYVLLKGADETAQAFHAYLRETEARQVFVKFGFDPL